MKNVIMPPRKNPLSELIAFLSGLLSGICIGREFPKLNRWDENIVYMNSQSSPKGDDETDKAPESEADTP